MLIRVQKERLVSLDVFRGGTIAAMIMVNNQASSEAFPQLEHSHWHGWTFTDLVFPFFLWIVGIAITFSFAKRVERGDDRGKLLLHTAKRAAIIFGVGLLLNGFPYYNLSTLRIPGVLQRIAVCYLIAATIFLFTKTRGRILWCVGLLSAYWILMKTVPVPGCGANSFTIDCNLEKWIDGMVLWGHMYSRTKTWDPEGIVSTLPAITNVLFGIFAGQILRLPRTPAEKASWLFSRRSHSDVRRTHALNLDSDQQKHLDIAICRVYLGARVYSICGLLLACRRARLAGIYEAVCNLRSERSGGLRLFGSVFQDAVPDQNWRDIVRAGNLGQRVCANWRASGGFVALFTVSRAGLLARRVLALSQKLDGAGLTAGKNTNAARR